MTATEHAEAIMEALGLKQFSVIGILAAVEATMQDARAEERGQIVGYLREDNERCDCVAYEASECGCGGWDGYKTVYMGTIAYRIEALAHKGAGNE